MALEGLELKQSLILVNGRGIILPPFFEGEPERVWGNTKLPDLSVVDTSQQYPLGTVYVDGKKEYDYGAVKGTLNPDLGAHNTQPQHVAYATIAAAADQYATEIVIDVAATDGRTGTGAIAKNELAGGNLVVFDASSKAFNRGIVANTVRAAGAGEMTLTLDAPIPVALIADTDHAECMASPYRYITASTSNAYVVVGIPQLVYTTGQFGWFQVRGPCWIAPQTAIGSGNNNILCIFRHDGSIDELDYSDAANSKGQIAGYVMAHAQGGGQGAAFINLMIR